MRAMRFRLTTFICFHVLVISVFVRGQGVAHGVDIESENPSSVEIPAMANIIAMLCIATYGNAIQRATTARESITVTVLEKNAEKSVCDPMIIRNTKRSLKLNLCFRKCIAINITDTETRNIPAKTIKGICGSM